MDTGPNPDRTGRLAGAIWLVYIAAAIPLALRTALIAPADAAATASHIAGADLLYRATIVSDLVSYVLYIAFIYLLYRLLRPLSRSWAAMGALLALAGCLVLIVSTSALTVPLILLDGSVPHATSLGDRQELALLALKTFGQAYTIALFFFGAQWLVMGPLLAISRVVPRPISYLLTVAGAAWIVLSATMLVAPAFGAAIRSVAMPLGGVAELALALWLLIKGARPPAGAERIGPPAS